MRCHLMRIAVILAVGICAADAQSAVLLYRQVFNPPAPDTSPVIGPWSVNAIGGFNGTYSGGFAASGLVDANSGAPIGRTGPADTAGTAAYTGIGGPVTGDLRAFYTVDGQAGDTFTLIDPALYPNLNFNIWANLQGGGTADFGRFIIQGQTGGSRGPKQWYVSTSPMAMPTATAEFFNLRSLAYDSSAGNWDLLTLDPTNTVAPMVGGPAGALPADTKIVGIGVLHSVTNADSSDFSSWNYADYRLTDGVIPEPAALLLLALATPAVAVLRRRK